MWINIQGYLVPTDQVQQAYRSLRTHCLFGSFLPRSSHFLYGFAAEYPWSAAFEFHESQEQQKLPTFAAGDAPVSVVPAWNEVVSEWEYDVTRPNINILTPARQLFRDDLWWDGRGGFSTLNDRPVFVDPSFRGTGSPAVLADATFLDERLLAENLSILLTMTGEKRVQAPGVRQTTRPAAPRFQPSRLPRRESRAL